MTERSRFGINPLTPDAPSAAQRSAASDFDMPAKLGLIGIALYLLLSPSLLVTFGYPYDVPRGNFFFKIHPGTYFIAAGGGWTLIKVFVGKLVLKGDARQRTAFAYLVVAVSALFYSMIRFGPGGNGFMIDTLIVPGLVALILLLHPPRVSERAFLLVLIILAVNALIGVFEGATQWRLVPYLVGDRAVMEDFFRATALGGHPLENALRTAVMLFACLVVHEKHTSYWLVPLFFLALLAFGSRAALTLSMFFFAFIGGGRLLKKLMTRDIEKSVVLILVLFVVIAVSSVVVLSIFLDLGTRIIHQFYWDRSADTRLLAYMVFDFTDLTGLLLGVGPEQIDSILSVLKMTTSLTDIENPWVLLILQIGLVPFVFLAVSLVLMVVDLVIREPAPLRIAAIVFFALASSNNSIASKTPSLAILMPILIGGAAFARAHSTRNSAIGERKPPRAETGKASRFNLPAIR